MATQRKSNKKPNSTRPNRMQRDAKEVEEMNDQQYTRKNSSRRQRRGKEVVDTAIKMSTSNPYAWYAKNPQFTKDAGMLAFGTPLGNRLSVGDNDVFAAAGIMRLSFIPTVGYSADLTSPINRSAMQFRTYLRSIMKASAEYDAADLMMYMMALDSAYIFWANMRRAYGVAQLYSPINKYYPRNLLQFLGFDPAIANNLAEFRAYINKFALSLGRFAVPAGFDITDRHMWMVSGLYLDSDTTRAQTYTFVPEGFWIYDNTVVTGSQLEFIRWQGKSASEIPTLHTLAQVQSMGDMIINTIINDTDISNISGDIFRAYQGKLRVLPETEEGYMLLPTYDETVLSQIENATIVGNPDDSTLVISQNPSVNNGAIIFQPKFDRDLISGSYRADNFQFTQRVLNMHWDSPTPEQVIEATRLTTSVTVSPSLSETSNETFSVDVFPADIITRVAVGIASAATEGALSIINVYTNTLATATSLTTSGLVSRLQLMALFMQFDWAPLLYVTSIADDASDLQYIGGDVDNITTVSVVQLKAMHEAAMFSLFDIPQVGSLSAK